MAPTSSVKRSVEDWAVAKGFHHPAEAFVVEYYDWRHAAAAAAHGWNEHAYHAGSAMMLTEAEYDGAIAAVQIGNMKPSDTAISQYAPKQQP